MLVHSKYKLFLFSQGSLHGIILESWFLSYPKLCLHLLMTKWQLIMHLPPMMNKRQLTSFRSLKIHHVLAFFWGGLFLGTHHGWRFASLLTHTWLIESEVLSCPYHLVIIERVEENQPLLLPLFWNSCLLLSSADGQRVTAPFTHNLENVLGCHISLSQYIYIYMYIYIWSNVCVYICMYAYTWICCYIYI